MIIYVLTNSHLRDLVKVGVTKNLDAAIKQLNRYVPSDFVIVWSQPGCVDRKVFDQVREAYSDTYLKNGYFKVVDVDQWVMELQVLLASSISLDCHSPVLDSPTRFAFDTTASNSSGEIITRTAAAAQLGVNPKTLYRWENDGKINVPQTPSGRPAYTSNFLDQLFQKSNPNPLPSVSADTEDDDNYL